MSKNIMVCAGIDTGKCKLDVAIIGVNGQRIERVIDNTSEGHEALSGWLREHVVERVGIEASGGYEQAVVLYLRRKEFVVVVFQPIQVRAFATFHLQLAKNDKLDAALIANCTAATTKIYAPADARLVPFAHCMTYIDQIADDMARLKTRRESCRDKRIRQVWSAEIARLQGLRKAELKTLVAAIREHDDLGKQLDLIESVDGVGLLTAVVILVRMPEIGRVTREQVAALAGVAPYDNESCDQVRERHIRGGRGRLRKSLFGAALPASFRWNHQLVALYKRLIAAGKPHKVALIACVRKLLIFVNTVVARGTPWNAQQPNRKAELGLQAAGSSSS
jgi:transposase